MSNIQEDPAIEQDRQQAKLQTSSILSHLSKSTIPSFQIINPELPSSSELKQPKNQYLVNYQLLFLRKIEPFHRYKLMKWLHSQVFRQKYYREVFGYTCYYLDSYLQKQEQVQLKDLQLIALAALLIATKIDGSTFPKLGKEFDINEIMRLQVKICLKLNYFLNPKTFVHSLNQYIQQWQNYITKTTLYAKDKQYYNQSLDSFQRHRSIYEKAECLNMAPKSHSFNMPQLMFNLFYLENKINMTQLNIKAFTRESLHSFILESFEEIDEYGFIFQEFISSSAEITYPALDLDIGLYLSSFITIPISTETPNRKCLNYESYLRMQTVSEEAVKALDRMVKKMV